MVEQKLIVFGIKRCDTVRKALRWLNENRIEYSFHDLRVDGFTQARLSQWLETAELNKLVNRRSTSWRQLPQNLKDNDMAGLRIELWQYPTLVKRPVFFHANKVLAIGFNPATQELLEQLA